MVVDEIAFQTRRNLAQRALVDILPFTGADQERIQEGARQLTQGQASRLTLPPRHIVSAASYALASGRIAPRVLADQVTACLNGQPIPRTEKSRPRAPVRPAPVPVA